MFAFLFGTQGIPSFSLSEVTMSESAFCDTLSIFRASSYVDLAFFDNALIFRWC